VGGGAGHNKFPYAFILSIGANAARRRKRKIYLCGVSRNRALWEVHSGLLLWKFRRFELAVAGFE
jgi:hypothetical protein